MTLLLMGVERLLSCFCRRYLVANSWIEVGARETPRIQPTVRDWRGANWLEALRPFGEMFLGLGVVLGWAELGSWGT